MSFNIYTEYYIPIIYPNITRIWEIMLYVYNGILYNNYKLSHKEYLHKYVCYIHQWQYYTFKIQTYISGYLSLYKAYLYIAIHIYLFIFI